MTIHVIEMLEAVVIQSMSTLSNGATNHSIGSTGTTSIELDTVDICSSVVASQLQFLTSVKGILNLKMFSLYTKINM